MRGKGNINHGDMLLGYGQFNDSGGSLEGNDLFIKDSFPLHGQQVVTVGDGGLNEDLGGVPHMVEGFIPESLTTVRYTP